MRKEDSLMNYQGIEKKFTETVENYLRAGWTFNTATMSGCQGERGKVDLLSPDGGEVIRVVLDEIPAVGSFIPNLRVAALRFRWKPGMWHTLWTKNGETVVFWTYRATGTDEYEMGSSCNLETK